jgi:hypothetical protein
VRWFYWRDALTYGLIGVVFGILFTITMRTAQ